MVHASTTLMSTAPKGKGRVGQRESLAPFWTPSQSSSLAGLVPRCHTRWRRISHNPRKAPNAIPIVPWTAVLQINSATDLAPPTPAVKMFNSPLSGPGQVLQMQLRRSAPKQSVGKPVPSVLSISRSEMTFVFFLVRANIDSIETA